MGIWIVSFSILVVSVVALFLISDQYKKTMVSRKALSNPFKSRKTPCSKKAYWFDSVLYSDGFIPLSIYCLLSPNWTDDLLGI